MGVVRINRDLCTGCGACIDDCPMDILRMNGADKAYLAYPEDCMDCHTCDRSCPVGAVEISFESKRKIWFSY